MNLEKAEDYAKSVFLRFPSNLVYHNFSHAEDVMKASVRIAGAENISPEETVLVKIAALYHDIGFIETYDGHEEKGIEIVRKMFPEWGFSGTQTDTICGMIRATIMPQKPVNLLEKILCDADLDNLGRSDFFDVLEKLYEEKIKSGSGTGKAEWYSQSLALVSRHEYFTQSARSLRNSGKAANIKKLSGIINAGC